MTEKTKTVHPQELLTKNTVEVEFEGDKFVFRLPTFMDEVKRAVIAEEMRSKLGTDKSSQTIESYLFAASVIVHFLEKGPKWIFSENEKREPYIDPWKWPGNKIRNILNVSSLFYQEVERFQDS